MSPPAGDAPYARSRVEGKNAFHHVFVEPGSSIVVPGSAHDEDRHDPTIGLIDPQPATAPEVSAGPG